MADGQIAVNPQTGERLVLRGGQWVPAGGGGAAPLRVNIPNPRSMNIPLAPQAQTAQNLDVANVGSQIGSRDVQNVNTAANTANTMVDTQKARLDLDGILRQRARGALVNDEFTGTVRNQLLALQQARGQINDFSTGTVGELIGDKPNAGGEGGSGLAGLPVIGGALYGGTDRSALKTNLATINSGAKFNMIDILKARGGETGSAGTGLGATAIPEFTALGQVNFNLEDLSGGKQEVNRQLNRAEETLLRRYAALTIPSEALVNATPEQRKRLLEDSYKAAELEYGRGFAPPSDNPPAPPQGGQPLRVDINQGIPDTATSVIDRMSRNAVGAGILSAADGFLLGGGDELLGGTPEEVARLDAIKQRMRDESPIASTVGTILGGAASFVPVGRAVSLGAKALGAGARAAGAALGATNVGLGATAGALDANDDRKAGAIIGGGAALAGDAAGRYIGGKIAGRLASQPTGAERAIASSVADPAAARGVLAEAERLGSPAGLVDASPALRGLGNQSVANSERAANMATNNIGGRDVDAITRAVTAIDTKLAKETDVVKLGRSIRDEGSNAVDGIYKEAFDRKAPVADPELADILKRPAVAKGLAFAREEAGNRGINWKGMGIDLDDQGEVVLKEGATFRSLDMAKRGVDSYLETFRNPITGKLDSTNASRAVVAAQEALVGRMKALNPAYEEALGTYAPFAARASALERGGKVLTASGVNAKQIGEVVSALEPDELAAFQIGAANNIIDTLKKAKDNADPFQVLRSTDMRERLAAVFPDKAGELGDIRSVADMESAMRRTREALLGGSATQGRQVAGQAFDAQAQAGQGILAQVAEPGSTITGTVAKALRLTNREAQRLQEVRNRQALADDLAPILLETDPKKARTALDGILTKVDKYDTTRRNARNVGASAGAAASVGILNQ